MDAHEMQGIIRQLKDIATARALKENLKKEDTTEWKAALILEQLMDNTYLRAMGALNNV